MKEVSLKELLEAGCHFGHQTARWHPKMKPYIFDAREGVHIFDLTKTKEGLEEAAAFAKTTASQGGKILFVGTKRQAKPMIEKTAKSVGMPYVNVRWLGGTLTNFGQIKKSLDSLFEMKRGRGVGEYQGYTKKEQLLIDRKIAKLERFLGGVVGLEKIPEAVFIVDVKRERSVAQEAKRCGIKVMAIVDTNSDPSLIDYIIPSNDDATKAIELILDTIGEAISEGVRKGEKGKEGKEEKEEVKKEEMKTETKKTASKAKSKEK